jgi:hypothetical protein
MQLAHIRNEFGHLRWGGTRWVVMDWGELRLGQIADAIGVRLPAVAGAARCLLLRAPTMLAVAGRCLGRLEITLPAFSRGRPATLLLRS